MELSFLLFQCQRSERGLFADFYRVNSTQPAFSFASGILFMTRICHLAASHTTFSGRMFYREALSARAAGFDVTIIGVADGFPANPPDHGCRVIPLPATSRAGKLLNAFRLFRMGRREPCAVYHCHDLASLTAGAALKLFTGRSLIYDAHENYPMTHAANISGHSVVRRPLNWAFSIYEWLLLRLVDEVFTVDPLIAHKFRQMGRAAHVLPNFPRLQAKQPLFDGLPDWNGRRAFIYVGSFNRDVAVLEMVEAVGRLRARYPEILLVLAGQFEEDRCQVEQFIGTHHLEQDVFLLNQISFTQVPALLSRAFAGLILYSSSDHYGDRNLYVVKLMEYMAAGLPIIASSFRGLSLILRRWRCGLVADPSSPEEIAAAMERLLTEPGLATRLGHASRRAFEVRFHWEAVEPTLITVYRHLEQWNTAAGSLNVG